MSLELILTQGLNFKNEGIIETIDTCEFALYSFAFDPSTMRIIPSMDDPSKPLSKPFVSPEYQKLVQDQIDMVNLSNLSAGYNPIPLASFSNTNPCGGYKPEPYAALSQPLTLASVTPIVPMSAVSIPSFIKPIIDPMSFIKPINPILDGGVDIYLKNCRPNTTILKEELGYDFKNIYVHHDKGPGRMKFIDPLADLYKSIREKYKY